MTPAQWRVLGLLGLALGINIAYNPTARSHVIGLFPWGTSGGIGGVAEAAKADAAWIVGAVVIELITAGSESIGTWLAVIILAFVVFRYTGNITQTISTYTGPKETKRPPTKTG